MTGRVDNIHSNLTRANCQQNWQLLKRQLQLAVETANRNWRQFWSQPRLQLKATVLEMIVVESRQSKNSRVLAGITRGNPIMSVR